MSGSPPQRSKAPSGDPARPKKAATGGRPVGARFHTRGGAADASTPAEVSPGRVPTSMYGGRPVGARFHAQAQAPASAAPAGSRTRRWRLRNWRLRSRLAVLLVIPVVLIGALGGLRIAESIADVQELGEVQRQIALRERVATVIESLQTERHLAAAAIVTDDGQRRDLFDVQNDRSDADIEAMRKLEPDPDGLAAIPGDAYQDVLFRVDGLPRIREQVFASGPGVDLAIGRYSEVIRTLLRFNRVALTITPPASAPVAAGIGYLAEAKEQLSLEHAMLLAASLQNEISRVQITQLRSSDAAFDSAIRSFSESVPSAQRQVYFRTVEETTLTSRQRLLLIGQGEWPVFVPLDSIAGEWDETATTLGGMFFTVESSLSSDLLAVAAESRSTLVGEAIRDGSIVALALLLALFLLVMVARSVLGPVQALRTAALDVATRRLPEVVEQLRHPGGWRADLKPEPVPVTTREDIGEVARAFDQVHNEAVRLATEQALMRSTVNDMFANLSRRSQSMVERQLRIIDSLESGERDPEALAELFRLDHLATRMRRNNENLLVLAGSETRQRTGAASRLALDVLRGAVSEIEEYPRIVIESVPEAAVSGVAVNDLVHLVAELLDNATTFSPKEDPVVLASSLQPDGNLLIEIRDTGVGMSATQRNAINDRLADPPMVDVSVSRHMGLFVVGRLAARHQIRVVMQATVMGRGLTAVVSVPHGLISPAAQQTSGPPRVATSTDVQSATVSGPQSPAPFQSPAIKPAATGSVFSPAAPGSVVTPAGTGSGLTAVAGSVFSPAVTGSAFDPVAPSPVELWETGPIMAADPLNVNLFAPRTSDGMGGADVGAGPFVGDDLSALTRTPSPANAAADGPEAETPIFQEMRSAWFSGKSSRHTAASDEADGAESVGLPAEPAATSAFGSAADEGWQAAEQLLTPVDAGTTKAGLPRRRPRARLVPGASLRPVPDASGSPDSRRGNVTRIRDAERVRGNLSSYQRGTRRGRHSSPAEETDAATDGRRADEEAGPHGELPSSQEWR